MHGWHRSFPFAYCLRRLDAVHDRHLNIHENRIKGLALNGFKGVLTIAYHNTFDAKGFKNGNRSRGLPVSSMTF